MTVSQHLKKYQNQQGFTLIELMLVFVLIGIFVSALQFNVFNNGPEEKLKQESTRFAGVFNLAAEYGMLNNIELGLVVNENSYQFLGFDGETWVEIPEQMIFEPQTVAQEVNMKLELDDLPIDDDQLFSNKSLFSENDDDFKGTDEEEKKLQPKVFVLSGGDITPFKLIFKVAEQLRLDDDVEYHVSGLFTLPLKIEGPFINGEK